ncbi:hypothetical protein [Pseudomonas sp. Fl4BN1]|uniref:hypothetical protein n=1 Tax=Pseudomonas sp. Fl4BN1 TaxID=2697651 RepID=UPI001377E080|nr:hypothetical protein [Pseudomonas sp. Fl4BN1]NBF11758.1 hypothetical protein [Pseudomonas sp. Fl4BN1]
MHPVRVEWLPPSEGGRKKLLGKVRYYPVAKFPDDMDWPNNSWSVVLELDEPVQHTDKHMSTGTVRFLMKNAPEEKMYANNQFEIYEGPQKVADVFLLGATKPNS